MPFSTHNIPSIPQYCPHFGIQSCYRHQRHLHETFHAFGLDEGPSFAHFDHHAGHCVSLCIRGLQCTVPSLDLCLSLTSMDLSRLEQAYMTLGRILLINKMCQGESPFNPNPGGILYGKPQFSVSAITWLVYDFCKRVLMETWRI